MKTSDFVEDANATDRKADEQESKPVNEPDHDEDIARFENEGGPAL